MRICIVYDHVFPQTVGGLERWLRDLALRLAAAGHEVTYTTMRHWDGEPPRLAGVQIVGLTPPGTVYRDGRRTLVPPIRFGWAVARFLYRRGGEFDVVHVPAFPYFPLLAAGALRRRGGYQIVVDWAEVWTRAYWQRYSGTIVGTVGWLVQRTCVRIPQRAFCMSRMHAERLVAEGARTAPTLLPGLYDGPTAPSPSERVEPVVVYAGRHIREKRVPLLVRAFGLARAARPGLRLEVYGDGPERARVEGTVRELGLSDSVRVLGHRPEQEVADALGRAACVATASEREGYGLVVVEAAARGTPAVVAAGAENAAVELVVEGVNGVVAAATPDELAAAILAVVEAGPALRASTASWFAGNADRLRLERSVDVVLATYADDSI